MMRLDTPNCPTCGCPALGTLETVSARCSIKQFPSGLFEHSGVETKVFWDEMKTVFSPEGITLLCEQGHDWVSPGEFIDEPPVPVPAPS